MAADDRELNRDPLTDEPGAHPIGTGVGAAGGALAGAAFGAMGGPLGAAVGGVAGAVAGGLAGKSAAETVNPTAEEAYWRDNYSREPYYQSGRSFDDYAPAYRLGLTGRTRYEDAWTSVEPRLSAEWESTRGNSVLNWTDAAPAAQAAWSRTDNFYRGTAAGDTSDGIDTDDVVEVLNDLAECCKDGEYGFRACAEQAHRQDLKACFARHAQECQQAAQELYAEIRSLGGEIDEGGSAAGAVHRGWVALKAKLTTFDDKAVLEECERGEDTALAHYRKALKQALPQRALQVVQRQFEGVQRNHDEIKRLRDAVKSGA